MSTQPKRQLTDDQLQKLSVAREKALAVRRAQHAERLKAKAAALETRDAPRESPASIIDEPSTVDPPIIDEPPISDPTGREASASIDDSSKIDPPTKSKRTKKKTPPPEPVVVVEQSSSDEDTFDSNVPGVIFVKRRRQKPKIEPPPPKTDFENEVDVAYDRMFNGQFHWRR